jgi:hypothetical protein
MSSMILLPTIAPDVDAAKLVESLVLLQKMATTKDEHELG